MKNLLLTFLSQFMVWFAFAQTQSIQERLGYPKETKLLIIHADDIGVSHSENMASIYAMEKGSVTSGSILVPCSWFPEIAMYASSHPNLDFGLHLAITSEWKFYKWGPMAHSKAGLKGLVNEHNYFFEGTEDVKKNSTAEEVELELRTQIEAALKYGIPITHLDSHMFALYSRPDLLAVYKKLGKEYKLPILLSESLVKFWGLDIDESIDRDDIVATEVYMAYPEDAGNGLDSYYKKTLKALQPGLNVLLVHTAYDNEEMRAICGNYVDYASAWRQQDFNFVTSDECKKIIKEESIKLITWREVKEKLLH